MLAHGAQRGWKTMSDRARWSRWTSAVIFILLAPVALATPARAVDSAGAMGVPATSSFAAACQEIGRATGHIEAALRFLDRRSVAPDGFARSEALLEEPQLRGLAEWTERCAAHLGLSGQALRRALRSEDPEWLRAELRRERVRLARAAGTAEQSVRPTSPTAGTISGMVTAEGTGTPLEGAYIELYNETGDYFGSTTTDSAGAYSLSGVDAGSYRLRTYNDLGYLDELWDNRPCEPYCNATDGDPVVVTDGSTTVADFALALGGTITGTVTEAGSGTPIESVYVRAYNSRGSWIADGYTDASGVFALRGFQSGSYRVATSNAENTGHLNELWNNRPCYFYWNCDDQDGELVAVTVGATTSGIDFDLPLGGSISGTVTELGSGLALGNAWLEAYISDGQSSLQGFNSVSTNSDGSYSIIGLPSGTYRVRVFDYDGHLSELFDNRPCALSCDLLGGDTVNVTAPSQSTGVNFALALGGQIAGTVTEDGAPASYASVYVWNADPARQWWEYIGQSSWDDGQYLTYVGLPTGSYYLRFFDSGYLSELWGGSHVPLGLDDPTTLGSQVSVTAGFTTNGINAALDRTPLFGDCFETGGFGHWPGTCGHSVCRYDAPLDPACDPCVAQICLADSYCCDTTNGWWDSYCVQEVWRVCGAATCFNWE
ncbi:MAG: hypothetical protein QG573_1754 [Acidobacteriota bacterium]|nr:hypothetical protein [Acidobacteriota bacterium]